MLESDFTSWTSKQIVQCGGIVIPLIGGSMTKGWPDRLVFHREWHGLIEFKAPRGKLREDQRINLERLNLVSPGHAVVARAGKDGINHTIENGAGETIARFVHGRSLLNALKEYAKCQSEALAVKATS